MKLGFIGCGNMATAIINGIINNGLTDGSSICGYDSYAPALEKICKSTGITPCKNAAEVMERCDVLFLAVKPNVIGSVLGELGGAADGIAAENLPLVVSIAAGKTLEFLLDACGAKFRIVRVMPNINAMVGEAVSAYCHSGSVSAFDKEQVEKILSCFGKCLYLDEAQFPIFGVLGGCAPAFAYMFIDSLARAGVKNGMKKDEALKIAAQTVYGSAKMIMESSDHPWKLIDNVCSPGGTTIEGVASLQSDGFESAVINAVDKSLGKDKKL